jgi:hypothetical protein
MQVPTIFLCLCWCVQRGCRSWPWAPIKIGMGFMTLLYEWGLVWSNIEDLHSCGLSCSWFCIFYVVWFIHIFSLGVKLWIQLVLHDTYNMELTTCWFSKVFKNGEWLINAIDSYISFIYHQVSNQAFHQRCFFHLQVSIGYSSYVSLLIYVFGCGSNR